MAYIETVDPEDASGDLKRQYDDAVRRAGRVWNIVRLMSPNPETMRASLRTYMAVMHGESPLTRAQREMLAVAVSQANGCRY